MQDLYHHTYKGRTYKLINTTKMLGEEKSSGQGTALPKPLTIQERRNFKASSKFRKPNKEMDYQLLITHLYSKG